MGRRKRGRRGGANSQRSDSSGSPAATAARRARRNRKKRRRAGTQEEDAPPVPVVRLNLFDFETPDLEAITPETYGGPSKVSNYVIPPNLLVGSYPLSRDMPQLLEVGQCNTFISLVTDRELRRHYDYGRGLPSGCETLAFPIEDHSIGSEEQTLEILDTLATKLEQGRRIYLHCMGGHGRTGYIVSLLLVLIFGVDSIAALKLCQTMHDARKKTKGLGSPESHEQRSFVHKMTPRILEERARRRGEDL